MTLLSELHPDKAYPATPTVPESGPHSLARYFIYYSLRFRYAGRDDCWVGEDRNIYYRQGDNSAVVPPDVFVTFGVDARTLERAVSYRVWEAGAPPAFVLEIISPKTYTADLEEKPSKYLEMGVSEYWRFDPSDELIYPALQGDRRIGDTWQPIKISAEEGGRLTGHSHALDLTLHVDRSRLRFRDPHTGTWLLNADEVAEANRTPEDRAAAAHARVRSAQALADRLKAATAVAEGLITKLETAAAVDQDRARVAAAAAKARAAQAGDDQHAVDARGARAAVEAARAEEEAARTHAAHETARADQHAADAQVARTHAAHETARAERAEAELAALRRRLDEE